MTNARSPPPWTAWTRPWLALPWRMLAELNRAPTASAATTCPASCQAVCTAAVLAGAKLGAAPRSYRCLIHRSCTIDSSS